MDALNPTIRPFSRDIILDKKEATHQAKLTMMFGQKNTPTQSRGSSKNSVMLDCFRLREVVDGHEMRHYENSLRAESCLWIS